MYGVWGGYYYVQMRTRHIMLVFLPLPKLPITFRRRSLKRPLGGGLFVSNMRGTRGGVLYEVREGSAREVPGTNAILSIFHMFYGTNHDIYANHFVHCTERWSGVDYPPRKKRLSLRFHAFFLCDTFKSTPSTHMYISRGTIEVGFLHNSDACCA